MRIPVLGVLIDAVTMTEAVAAVEKFITEGRPHIVATANAEMVMSAGKDPELGTILAAADMVVPDGAGVVWAARHHGYVMPERVAGFDLAQALLSRAATCGYRTYFFGGAPGVADKAATVARQRYPGLIVAGVRNGFFASADNEAIIDDIRAAKPELLFVALGVPKQEKWLYANLEALGVPVSMGVGGTFDVMAGIVRRAPLWMQKAGLEWFFRLACQPQRVLRMLVLPRFVLHVLAAKKG